MDDLRSGHDARLLGISPTLRRREVLRLCWAPGVRFVLVHGCHIAEYGVHHSPGRFHGILTRKQPLVAAHRIAEQPLVRHHLARWMVTRDKLDLLADHQLAGLLGARAYRDEDIWAESKTDVVGALLIGPRLEVHVLVEH